jgi:hypothetical protein
MSGRTTSGQTTSGQTASVQTASGETTSGQTAGFRERRLAYVLALFSACLFWANPALAREKSDVIFLKNGDRITGEVKNLTNGALKIDLDYVDGSISLDWLQVARIESKHKFLVELQDGSIYSAYLISPETAGSVAKLQIQPEDETPVNVNATDIVRVTQTSEQLLQRFSGNLSLGSTYTKGNRSTQYNVGSGIQYLEERWGSKLDYNSNLSSSSGATTSTRNQLNLSAYRLLPWKNYFYGGIAGYLQSSAQNIQRQTSIGLVAGRFLTNTNRVRLSLMAGPGWQNTHYLPETETVHTQDIAVATVSGDLQVFSFKKSRLDLSAATAPAITRRGRVFSRVNATYYWKIFGKIDWNFSFYGNWDSQPPEHLAGGDYGSSTGVSYTFGNK